MKFDTLLFTVTLSYLINHEEKCYHFIRVLKYFGMCTQTGVIDKTINRKPNLLSVYSVDMLSNRHNSSKASGFPPTTLT